MKVGVRSKERGGRRVTASRNEFCRTGATGRKSGRKCVEVSDAEHHVFNSQSSQPPEFRGLGPYIQGPKPPLPVACRTLYLMQSCHTHIFNKVVRWLPGRISCNRLAKSRRRTWAMGRGPGHPREPRGEPP